MKNLFITLVTITMLIFASCSNSTEHSVVDTTVKKECVDTCKKDSACKDTCTKEVKKEETKK